MKIGLTNLACGMMCAQFQSEIPDAINAMFNSHNASVSMYVAQFPEWEQFTQKAAAIELDADQISEIDKASEDIISKLESHPELADSEVPKTIRFVRELMSRPGTSAKRAAFAMMRTIENLISVILRYSVTIVSKTAEKTADHVSKAASAAIVGLLGIALAGALGISSPAFHAGVSWVKQAVEIVQKEIEHLAGK